MTEDSKASGQSNASGPDAGKQPEQQGRNVDTQQKKNYEIKSEAEYPEPESPSMENIEEQAEMELGEALKRLEEAEDMVRKHQDDMLRLQAEMQNLRRRTEQDVEKAHKYGQERFATGLLSVIDNLERAIDAASLEEGESEADATAQSVEKLKAIREGVDLTLKTFLDCFSKFNIEIIDPLGEPFDPQMHEAMAAVENDQVEPNTVTAVMQKGYTLHGRVLRPAMVMVSK